MITKEELAMKITRALCALLAIILMLASACCAEESIAARLDGDVISIQWTATGTCVLTVYKNGWPISISNVDGASGGTEVRACGDGKYSVRLKTSAGCFGADVDSGDAVLPITQAPTVRPTPNPTVAPTVSPTADSAEAPTDGSQMEAMAAEVVRQVNAERTKQGLNALEVSEELTRAASVRAGEIVQTFSHTRPDGTSWSTVSDKAYGENIAKGQNSADRVMASWMASEGHRANILRASYGSIGVCAVKVGGVIYWVQMFGK